MINYNRWSYGNYQLVSPIPSDNAPRWSNGGILLLHEAESSTNITITHITSVLNVSINNHNYLIDTVINHISKYISFTVNTHSIVTIEDVLITHSASNLNFISGTHNVIIDNIYNHAINNITVSTNSHQVNIDNVIIHTASVIALETKTHTALIDEVISHEFSNFTLSAGSHTALSDISVLHSSSSISFTPNNHTVLLTAVIEHASSTIEYTLGTHNIITDSLIQHTLSSLQFSTGSHNVLTDTIIEHQSTTFTLTSNTHTAIIGYIYPHTASSITYTIGVHEVTSDNIINHNTNSIEFNTGSHTISADLIVLHTSESFVLTVGSHAVGSDVIVNHSTNQIEFISGVHSITVDRVITHSTNSIEFTTLSHETYTDVIISHTSQAFAFTTGTHATGADLIVNHSYSALTFTSNSHTISVDQIITHSSISLEFTSNSHTVASDIIVSHALSSIEYSIGTHVATEDIIVSHVAQSVIYSIGSHSITISASVIHATTGIQFTLGSHTIFSDIVVNHGSSLINFTAGTHSVIADIVISHTLSEFELSSNTHTVTADRVIDHSASSINFTAGSHNALTDTYITHSVSSIEFSTNKHIISVDVIVSHAVSTFEFTPGMHASLNDIVLSHSTDSFTFTVGTHTVIISEIIEHSTTSIEFTPQSHDLILDVVILPSTTSFVFTPGIHVYAIDLFIEHVTTVLKFHINTNRITTTSQIPHHGSAELTLDDLVGKEVTPEILQSLTTEGRVSFPLKDTQTSAVSQGEDQLDPDGTTTTEGNVDEYIDSIKENEDMVKMLEDMRDDMLKDMKIPPANADIADAAKQLGSPDGTITANIWATAQTIMDIIHQTQTGNDPVLGAITGNGSISGDFIKCSEVTQAIADNWKISVNGDPATSDELHKQNSMSSVQQAKESFSTKMKNMYLYIRDMLWWNLIWARLVIFFIELLEKVVAIPIDTPFLILRFFKKLTPDNYQQYGPIHKMLNRLKILLLCRVPVNAFSEYKPDEDIQVWYPIGKNGKFMSLRELCSQSTTVKECPPGQSPWPDETNNQGTWAKDSAEQKLASVKNILVNNFDNSDTCIPTSFIDNLFKKSNIKGPGMSPDCAEAAKKVIEAVQDDALHFGEYEGIIIEPDPEATVIIADTTPINEVISKNFIGLGPDQETSTFAKSGTATSFAKSGNATSVGGSIGIGTGLKSRKKEEEFDFYELPTSSSDTDRIASIMRTAILTGAGSDMNSVYYNLNDVTIDGMTNEPVYPLDITANLVDASLFINGVTYDLDSWIDSSGNETVIRTGNDGYSVSYNTDGLYISIKWNNTADNSGFDLNGEDSIIYKYWVD